MLRIIIFRILLAALVFPIAAEEVRVVALPEQSVSDEGEKVKVYIRIHNTSDQPLTVMGGSKSKSGLIYPLSCGYDLDLYDLKGATIESNFSVTGFLSPQIPAADYDSKVVSLKVGDYESACYLVEVIPFPKGRSEKYSSITFMISTDRGTFKATINLERKEKEHNKSEMATPRKPSD
jgi:hypothetical protein